MHFRAVSLDSGLPLAGDAVAALFPRGSWPQQPEQLVGFVGLQEHPLLPGSCWLALHPCNTAAALALALELQLGEAALAAADAAAAGGAVGEEAAAAAIASGAGAVCAVGAVQERYGGDREVAAAARGAGAERRGADQGTSEGVPQVVGAGGGVGGAGGSRCAEEQDGEAGVPDVDELLAAIAAAQQQARAGAGGEAGAGAAPAWAVVGPAGVRWPGDEVPVCPGEPALLARYMRAWLGLDAVKREEERQTLLARLTQPRDPDNILLHEVWEPWARGARFLTDRFRFPSPDYTRRDQEHEMEGWAHTRGVAYRDFACAVPSAEALGVITRASGGRVVEVGAGTGYWAWLLSRRGVDVVAVDNGEEYVADGPEFLARHGGCRDRALLLCWAATWELADKCVAAYRGDIVVAVTEPDMGAIWELDTEAHPEWELVQSVPLPSWPRIRSALLVFKRVPQQQGDVDSAAEGEEPEAEGEEANEQPRPRRWQRRRRLQWRRSLERVTT
ncbi:hypothetical protein HXX76_005294 [Chlamydomonas incerta]|uniref:Uncharacterized protein n=1 Tax=Chlamydomonas incerta TaxID=51695 RepID=A0A835THD4_CHLIN|nr:hypothetical protein HXX76_005294 [Chlamydomonas incerta]|eukprot:KAG2438750.1 hypothetical protein HXX76_005294 [Chlamydomonas incerta]